MNNIFGLGLVFEWHEIDSNW